jgi:hypothetical protein
MKPVEQRPIRSTWFIVVLTAMILACAETQVVPDDPDNTSASLSDSKAVLNQWYEGTVTSYSNYIDTVEFHANVVGNLPPGITWSTNPAKFSGYPTTEGVYSVTVYFRDPAKGTYEHPSLADDMWYTHTFEIEVSRFEQPEYTTTVAVTFENTATWSTNVYVDGASVAYLSPGQSTTVWVRSGTRVFQYNDEDGTLGNESVRTLEAGESYTMTLRIE